MNVKFDSNLVLKSIQKSHFLEVKRSYNGLKNKKSIKNVSIEFIFSLDKVSL
jgi:hypothetical protein